MGGYYSNPAPDAPRLVQMVDRLYEHRYTAVLVVAGLLGSLIGLSFFMLKLALTLLAVCGMAILGVFIIIRAQSHYRTHWTRETKRR